ncbi:hypothetical protein K443DRAFT_81456 [Laccaria amethystina LaAM-08-1]|uniref:Uncharacterized protein n=1 Tax=Laccaria amethystina LaAM-08-1 TaxID=1095629 RepID=A0A0C9YJ77_9AGAR|nr:hypothetical protein K443DRAFT_81456 [Laccaria amethystina LaAM-08-1]
MGLKIYIGLNWTEPQSSLFPVAVAHIWDQLQLPVVFASSVQSSFLPPKRATVDRNRSRTDPHIAGTEPDHLGPDRSFAVHPTKTDQFGPVFWCNFCYTNRNHFYLNYHYSEN